MKILTIIAEPRPITRRKNPRKLIPVGIVPGVLYGKKGTENITIPFQVATLDIFIIAPCFIDLTLNKETHRCIIQERQYHPVSDNLIHVDLLRITETRPITMDIPLQLVGNAIGVDKGGILVKRIRRLRVQALPKDMPEKISLDVSNVDLGKTIKIKAIVAANYTILHSKLLPVAMVEIPRALRSKASQSGQAT